MENNNSHQNSKNRGKRKIIDQFDSLGQFKLLPIELIIAIFSFLSFSDLKNCGMLSKIFYSYCNSKYVTLLKLGQLVDINQIPKPIVDITKLYNEIVYHWYWNNSINDRFLTISDNQLIVTRPKDRGTNPAMMTIQPFTRINNWYQVEIIEGGRWIGIGLADENFELIGASTLGRQKGRINASYFCQDDNLLQMENIEPITLPKKICNGDRIKVVLNFDSNFISFYSNDQHLGNITPTILLSNYTLYPCVMLGYQASIKLIPLDSH